MSPTAPAPGSDGPLRVAVCMCTHKRPEVLGRLLQRIAECAAQVSADRSASGVEVRVVVVDDDPAASARVVAERASGLFDMLDYSVTGAGDITVARNRAIERGLAHGDLLVFIDDDCTPEVQWLDALLHVHAATGADMVSGACDTTYPPTAPSWLRDEPFTDPRATIADRAPTDPGYVKNMLVTADFLRRTGLRFVACGKAAGEDAIFKYDATDAGVRNVFAADAVVWEDHPAHRTSVTYQWRRRLWYGNSESLTSIRCHRATRLRMLLRGAKMVVSGAARPASRLIRRQNPQIRFAVGEVLRGCGRVAGAVGIRLRHR